jgi:hypothetical protein
MISSLHREYIRTFQKEMSERYPILTGRVDKNFGLEIDGQEKI